jgi:hypothetical protein
MYPSITKQIMPKVRPFAYATYFVHINEEFKLNLDLLNTSPTDILHALELKVRETIPIDPMIMARYKEIELLVSKGIVKSVAPIQVDMKNNAIQHAATLVNNIVNMQATGVLPTDTKVDDVYMITAKRVYNILKSHSHIE